MSHFPAGGETGVSLVRIYVSRLLTLTLSWLVSGTAPRETQRKVHSSMLRRPEGEAARWEVNLGTKESSGVRCRGCREGKGSALDTRCSNAYSPLLRVRLFTGETRRSCCDSCAEPNFKGGGSWWKERSCRGVPKCKKRGVGRIRKKKNGTTMEARRVGVEVQMYSGRYTYR